MKRFFGKKSKTGNNGRRAPGPDSPAGTMRVIDLEDHLGYLVPPGLLTEGEIAATLMRIVDRKRFQAGPGVSSVPTRYVVTMNPSDRAWLNPFAEERLASALTRRAERSGASLVGSLSVEIECDPCIAQGLPRFWTGFADTDLLILVDPYAVHPNAVHPNAVHPNAGATVFSRN